MRPRADGAVPAVILKLVPHRLQHGGLGIARSLGRLGVPVQTAYVDGLSAASWSRFVVARHRLPSDGDDSALLERLETVAAASGHRPVLIAADDVATLFVDRHRHALDACFRLPAQPIGLPPRLADKGELARLCAEHGIAAPRTCRPRDLGEALNGARQLGYPVVVKSMDPRVLRERPAARSVEIARDERDLRRIHVASEVPGRPNLMLQEHIPGGPQRVWMFNGYVARDGGVTPALTGIKLRQSPPGTGSTTLGMLVRNEAVADLSRRFLEAVGYRGMVDMGFRHDPRDGRYKLLDVNPRIGATFRLFVDRRGTDVARAQYLDLVGRPLPPAAAGRDGRRWIVEQADLQTAIALRRRGELRIRDWLRSLRGVDETAWGAPDDPLPLVGLVALGWLGVGRRVLRHP